MKIFFHSHNFFNNNVDICIKDFHSFDCAKEFIRSHSNNKMKSDIIFTEKRHNNNFSLLFIWLKEPEKPD